MPNSPAEMIEEIAEGKGIELENTSIECILYIYALVFRESEKILERKVETIPKKSIELIRNALDEIHIKFGHFKGEGKLEGKKYSDVEQISPLLEKALSHIIAALSIHNHTKPDPQQRAEKLSLTHLALRLYSEDLLACRRYITEINNQIGWWYKEEKAKDCLNISSAPPSTPTDIAKEKKRRNQKLA